MIYVSCAIKNISSDIDPVSHCFYLVPGESFE